MSNNPNLPYFAPVTAPPREWQAGDLIESANSTVLLFAKSGEAWQVMHRNRDFGWVSHGNPSFTNAGPHKIEFDSKGGLRFVKVEEDKGEGWVNLEQCAIGDAVETRSGYVGLYCGIVSSNRWGIVLPGIGREDFIGTMKVRVVGKFTAPKQEIK